MDLTPSLFAQANNNGSTMLSLESGGANYNMNINGKSHNNMSQIWNIVMDNEYKPIEGENYSLYPVYIESSNGLYLNPSNIEFRGFISSLFNSAVVNPILLYRAEDMTFISFFIT